MKDLHLLATRDDHAAADCIRQSPLFDERAYLDATDDPAASRDPALHYLLVGERAGAAASAAFSAETYERLNPDLARQSMNRLLHYETHGRSERRAARFETEAVELDDAQLDPGKPTVMLLLHEATYSGAPILGWNLLRELTLTCNTVVVLRRGGALQPALRTCASVCVGPISRRAHEDTAELDNLAARLNQRYAPLYVIANSVETRRIGLALRGQGVPLIGLVHEFASHSAPYELTDFYAGCDALVFPSELVRRSSQRSYPLISQRRTYILPQGASEVPRLDHDARAADGIDAAHAGRTPLARALLDPDPRFTVLGLGAVDLRKGVDLFIASATALKARHPELKFRFIWCGERVHPTPHAYYTLIDEQIERAGLDDCLVLAGATDDLEPLYAAADAFLLSSRLDPLPNVGIDAALRGVPLLCFRDATGFAELLDQSPATAWLVAPYLDVGTIADSLGRLALDPESREAACTAIRRMARRRFNMIRYVARLDELGREAAHRRAHRYTHANLLMDETAFDPELYFRGRTEPVPETRSAAIEQYLEDTCNVDFSGDAAWGHHPRRALAGFHALAYAAAAPGFTGDQDMDPLTHFIANGRPAGPWSRQVIRLEAGSPSPVLDDFRTRVAIHGHFHYTDNLDDFLQALNANRHPVDLFLTVTSETAAGVVRDATAAFSKGRVHIDVTPNVGRDIGPFEMLLKTRLRHYDLVGHVHGKRSVHTLHYDPELGNRWRQFLWQHLIGPAAPVADIVIDHFNRDPRLGMVFPENDFLVGWEKNREIAQSLAPRFGLATLPDHIDFPVGTMFWVRPAALKRFVGGELSAEDYPEEPLPIDGTMLHALERMLPLMVEAAGFGIAKTYLPTFAR